MCAFLFVFVCLLQLADFVFVCTAALKGSPVTQAVLKQITADTTVDFRGQPKTLNVKS